MGRIRFDLTGGHLVEGLICASASASIGRSRSSAGGPTGSGGSRAARGGPRLPGRSNPPDARHDEANGYHALRRKVAARLPRPDQPRIPDRFGGPDSAASGQSPDRIHGPRWRQHRCESELDPTAQALSFRSHRPGRVLPALAGRGCPQSLPLLPEGADPLPGMRLAEFLRAARSAGSGCTTAGALRSVRMGRASCWRRIQKRPSWKCAIGTAATCSASGVMEADGSPIVVPRIGSIELTWSASTSNWCC